MFTFDPYTHSDNLNFTNIYFLSNTICKNYLKFNFLIKINNLDAIFDFNEPAQTTQHTNDVFTSISMINNAASIYNLLFN